jgi:hypothetical protein
MNTAASISLSQINSSMFFTNGNVGINTTVPASTVDISGTFRASGVSALTNVTATNVSTGVLIASTGLTTGTINATGLSTLTNTTATNVSTGVLIASTGLTTGTISASGLSALSNVTAISVTTGTLTATTSVSSGLLSATNVIGNFISAGTLSGTTITGANLSLSGNLTIAGTLTTVNITSTNVLNTNVSAGTISATTGITTGTIMVNGPGGAGTNGSVLITGRDSFGHTLSVASEASQKRLVFNHNGTVGNIFSFDYGAMVSRNLCLQLPGGNVGIGTTSPAYTLDVNGAIRGTSVGPVAHWFGANAGTNHSIIIQSGIGSAEVGVSNGGPNFVSSANSGDAFIKATTNKGIVLQGNGGSGTYAYVTNAGVGINTLSPGYTLDVAGSGRFSNSLTVNNSGSTNVVLAGMYAPNLVGGGNSSSKAIFEIGQASTQNNCGMLTYFYDSNNSGWSRFQIGIKSAGSGGNESFISMAQNSGTTINSGLTVNGGITSTGYRGGIQLTPGSQSNNNILTATGSFLVFASWNNGAGYALLIITSSNSTTLVLNSSNSAGGNSGFNTVDDWWNGSGIAIFYKSNNHINVQGKNGYSGGTVTVNIFGA